MCRLFALLTSVLYNEPAWSKTFCEIFTKFENQVKHPRITKYRLKPLFGFGQTFANERSLLCFKLDYTAVEAKAR